MIIPRKRQWIKISFVSILIIVLPIFCTFFIQDTKPVFGNDVYTITFDVDPDFAGAIWFDGTMYFDGQTVDKSSGTYSIIGGPSATYNFVRWETSEAYRWETLTRHLQLLRFQVLAL